MFVRLHRIPITPKGEAVDAAPAVVINTDHIVRVQEDVARGRTRTSIVLSDYHLVVVTEAFEYVSGLLCSGRETL